MAPKSTRKAVARSQDTIALSVKDIVPDPGQPRNTFDAEGLSSLAQNLLEMGQISPIMVRPGPEGKYIIVVGERRWRAAKDAGLSRVECIIRDDVDERKAREMQFAENYHREDVPPLEQARSWKRYLDEYRVSQREFSRRTGIPQRTISDRLALLSLPVSVHAQIEAGEIGPYEGLKIAALPADRQEAVAEAVASGRIGGRDLEKLTHPSEFPNTAGRVTQEAPQPTESVEATSSLSRRLRSLERALYELAATYAYNQIAKGMEAGGGKASPCPECLRRGNKGWISGIKRKMTPRDRRELIEAMEEARNSEEDIEELLEPEPTHLIEARCPHCGYREFIGYTWE